MITKHQCGKAVMKVFLLLTLTIFHWLSTSTALTYRRWKEDFEDKVIGDQWENSLDHPELTKITSTTSVEGKQTKALQVKYLKDKFGGESRVRRKTSLRDADAYVLEFEVKFGNGFDFKKGGKLPGLCGGSCTTGCKNITADGWSSRFVWKDGNKLQLYIYDQDRDDGGKPNQRYCGTVYDLHFSANTEEWIKLRMEIKINTPGKHDGLAKILINGKVKYSNPKTCWRGDVRVNKAQIDLFYFTTFFGGSTQVWAPTKDSYAYFDNFKVYQPKK